jgi:hypothetical protein
MDKFKKLQKWKLNKMNLKMSRHKTRVGKLEKILYFLLLKSVLIASKCLKHIWVYINYLKDFKRVNLKSLKPSSMDLILYFLTIQSFQ